MKIPPSLFRWLMVCVAVADLLPAAALAAPGDVEALNVPIGAGQSVNTVVVQPDGRLIIAGDFTTVLGVAHSRIARLNVDGTLDLGFDPNPDGDVFAVAVQADGKVLLAGQFNALRPNGAATNTTRNCIARVNADGSLDTGFDPNASGPVNCLAVQANGQVLLGGQFQQFTPNGAAVVIARHRIARLNADGTVDPGFDPNANNAIAGLAVQLDGKVLLSGGFTTLQPNGAAAPTPRNYLARLNADGTLDSGFDPNANNAISSLAVQADGKVLLSGAFTTLQPNGAAAASRCSSPTAQPPPPCARASPGCSTIPRLKR